MAKIKKEMSKCKYCDKYKNSSLNYNYCPMCGRPLNEYGFIPLVSFSRKL